MAPGMVEILGVTGVWGSNFKDNLSEINDDDSNNEHIIQNASLSRKKKRKKKEKKRGKCVLKKSERGAESFCYFFNR